MNGIFVDSCVLLDLFTNDPLWADWSEKMLEQYSQTNTLYINSIVYAEVSIGFTRIEDFEQALSELSIRVVELPREVLFLTGKEFLKYRKNKEEIHLSLSDFFIGAHALASNFGLITRNLGKYTTYFPTLILIHPKQSDEFTS